MDLRKIGKFIAKKRQENNFTQESLAEKLGISNRSVSKWERGICLPDAINMAALCKLFNISYNELLSGEEFKNETYAEHAEKVIKDLSEAKAVQDKKLFLYENIIGYMSAISFIILIFTASFAEMPDAARIILILLGLVIFIIGVSFCIKIETEVGKYKCKKCGHLYTPKYSSVYLSMHYGRTRYMTCPKCHQKSWQKKVI